MLANRYEIGSNESEMTEAGIETTEIGIDDHGMRFEIGAAVRKVLETARDARQPAPPMCAVDPEAPEQEGDDVAEWFTETAEEAGELLGVANPFPKMTRFLQRAGAGQDKPRYVRVDTEDSYCAFRAAGSPEMAEFAARIAQLEGAVAAHGNDPNAHGVLAEALDEAEAIGAEAAQAEEESEIELWLPPWAEGNVRAWREGDMVGASICCPGPDGKACICTSMMPAECAVDEMECYAADAGVPADVIGGVLPAMGCVLGAGTLVKEMAAAAPAIVSRPEAASKQPFVVRIEPKANPALAAFIALAQECAAGDAQACAEWDALASVAEKGGAGYVSQAMREAINILRGAGVVAVR